jgi:hypothetical protein
VPEAQSRSPPHRAAGRQIVQHGPDIRFDGRSRRIVSQSQQCRDIGHRPDPIDQFEYGYRVLVRKEKPLRPKDNPGISDRVVPEFHPHTEARDR